MVAPKKSKLSAPEKAVPARNLREVSPHRMTGGWSIEGLTPYDAEHQSQIEKQAIWLLSLCHDVLEIRTQPSKEDYVDQSGKQHKYYPDILVELTDGPLYIEVKSLAELTKPKSVEKYTAIAREYVRQKMRFAFLVDAQLRQEPLFQTISIMRRYVNSQIDSRKSQLILNALENRTLKLPELLSIDDVQLVDIFVMMAKKLISFDIHQSIICGQLSLSLPDQPYEGIKLANILHSTRYGDLLESLAMGHRPTDQSKLARAQAWGQLYQSVNPYQFVGEFTPKAPVRDLGKSEYSHRKAWDRRDQAPGAGHIKPYLFE